MPSETPARVLLVDDHHMVRQGLRFFLSTQPNITVVGEATNAEDALELVGVLRPDVVLMDIVLPNLSGIEAMQAINECYPEVSVIILSAFVDTSKVVQAIQAGAAGYLMKDVDPEELAAAIQATRQGKLYLHPEAARRLAEAMRPDPGQNEPSPDVLTERELEVLRGDTWFEQSGDQRAAQYHAEDSESACEQHSAEAGSRQSRPGRSLRAQTSYRPA